MNARYLTPVDAYSHLTRTCVFVVDRVRLGDGSLTVVVPRMYNMLSASLRYVDNYTCFMRLLKTNFVQLSLRRVSK